jgi:hypothetical protein
MSSPINKVGFSPKGPLTDTDLYVNALELGLADCCGALVTDEQPESSSTAPTTATT